MPISVVVSCLAGSSRNEDSSAWQVVYSENYYNLVAMCVQTLQEDKIFVRLDDNTFHHFDVLESSKLCDAPDGEAVYASHGKMRRAMDVFPWGVVLNDVVRRVEETGEARHVRVTVDETEEYGFCLRYASADFDRAPEPHAPAHLAPVPQNHVGVWRYGQKTHPEGVSAIGGDRDGYHLLHLPRRECSRSPRCDRSSSASPPRDIEATWPTCASSSAAVALFGSTRVHDVCLRASRGAAVSAVAHAWVDQVTGLRRAVERANGHGVDLALPITGQAVARAVDGEANYERFAQHLESAQPEEAVAPTRFNAQSVQERRVDADGGPFGGVTPSARNTWARSVSQESGASVGSRNPCRRGSRRSGEKED